MGRLEQQRPREHRNPVERTSLSEHAIDSVEVRRVEHDVGVDDVGASRGAHHLVSLLLEQRRRGAPDLAGSGDEKKRAMAPF